MMQGIGRVQPLFPAFKTLTSIMKNFLLSVSSLYDRCGGKCLTQIFAPTRLQSKVLLALALSIWGGLIADLRGELSTNASVFAVGLDYPRGLRFGPDGNLYVAEAGRGGPNSTIGLCPQDESAGPFHGGLTARVSRVSPAGVVTTFVQGLPSHKPMILFRVSF